MKVYEAICAVTQDMSRMGISKDHRNAQQGYSFRGIDDVYRALSPLLARHRLCILPRVVEQTVVERPTQKGGMLFYTTVKMDFDFVSADDGTKHTVTMIGEAMDSADKSSNKAQSAAYKYACFQAFCIPTEGDNDADATTHEVEPQSLTQRSIADHLAAIDAASDADALKKAWTTAQTAAKTIGDVDAYAQFKTATNARKEALAVAA